jgi:hypothetical protein
MGGTEEAGFFHFRQCRIDGRKSPTMSWHNSERGRETMRIMTGLGGDHDPRGFRNNRDTLILQTRIFAAMPPSSSAYVLNWHESLKA